MSHDRARVDASTEERAERDIAHQPEPNGFRDAPAELGDVIGQRQATLGFVPELPVPADLDASVADLHPVRGRQLTDPSEGGPGRRDVLKSQVVIERDRLGLDWNLG